MAIDRPTKISVVIIAHNEANTIEKCLSACLKFSDDIVLLDSGSTDGTVGLAEQLNARVYYQSWLGYGPQKNKANALAKYDWILSLDADEVPDPNMIHYLNQTPLQEGQLYTFKLDDHFGERKIKYSELRAKWKKRLFNKRETRWDDREVHEQLIYPANTRFVKGRGRISHYSYNGIKDFQQKIEMYALLGADQMIKAKSKPGILKKIINPYFRFFRSYFLYLGILEGRLGFEISKILKDGLKLKYRKFDELSAGLKKNYD